MQTCPICKRETENDLVFPADVVVAAEIRTQHPEWREGDGVCETCVAEYEKRLQG